MKPTFRHIQETPMGFSVAFHEPVLADVMTFTAGGEPMVSLIFRDANRQECKIITPHINAAIAAADAFNAEVSRSRAAQKPQQSGLEWGDYFGGSGRAVVSDGHYFVTMICGYWLARKFDGQSEVWRGGFHATEEAAQAACEAHYRGENGPVTA
jgi:hypothetical protein